MSEPLSKNGWTRAELESQILWSKGHIVRLESRVESARSGLLAAQQELETLDAPVPKVECWGADNPKDGPVKEYIWKNPDQGFKTLLNSAEEAAPEGVDRVDLYTSEGNLIASRKIKKCKTALGKKVVE